MYATDFCTPGLITAQFLTPFKLGGDAEKTKFAPLDRQKSSKFIPSLFNYFSGFESAIFTGRGSQGA
jgi:hypothetical protein